MENIKWTHKIHKTNENTEKMSFKEDWLFFLISTQQSTLRVFYSHVYSITSKFD